MPPKKKQPRLECPSLTIDCVPADLFGAALCFLEYDDALDVSSASGVATKLAAHAVEPWVGDEAPFADPFWDLSDDSARDLLLSRNKFLAEVFGVSGERWRFAVHCWESTDDDDIAFVAELTQLTTLTLDGCSSVTDDGLAAALSNGDVQLRRLGLGECTSLTSEVGALIAKFPTLTSLNVGFVASDALLSGISGSLRRLVVLDVSSSDLDDSCVKTIVESFPLLRYLDLSRNAELSDSALDGIDGLVTLEVLSVAWCDNIGDNGARRIAKLPKLTALDLSFLMCELSDAGLKVISDSCKTLKSIACFDCGRTSEKAWKHLPARSEVDHLDFVSKWLKEFHSTV